MKVVYAIVMIFVLVGCTQARYRSQECDSFYYGQYQAMGEPKALAFAIPVADPQSSTQYDTRCWARGAAGRLPVDMTTDEAMSIVIAGVLRDCKEYNKENNSLQAVHELDCRIAARNLVWEPWVNELRAADALAQGDISASVVAPTATTVPINSAYAAMDTGYTVAPERPLPNFAPPPVSSVSVPASSAPAAAGYTGREVKQFGFNDTFSWCPSPGDWCNNDQIIGIKHPLTGQLIGRLAIYIRPQEVFGSLLAYTVQLNNESYCNIVIEGFEITQDDRVLDAWAITDPGLDPAGSQTVSQRVTFRDGASSNAVVSINAIARECQQ
jgi:hypothetical protein